VWRFALVWWVVGCKPSAVVLEPVGVAEPVRVAEPASATGDRDLDGIVDARDACPDVAEDVDQFEDEDGCVDRDNDEDGVVDAFEWKEGNWTNCDRRVRNGVAQDCRNLPEDMDGVEDSDGCPDVRRGVARERFEVRGFGDAVPIADEKKPGGREANRRVEFMATGLDSCTCRPIVVGAVESGTCV